MKPASQRRPGKSRRDGGRGALIKGMSRRLPSEMPEDRLFRERLGELMKGYAGIYALYRGKKLYYTGLMRKLFGRIHSET